MPSNASYSLRTDGRGIRVRHLLAVQSIMSSNLIVRVHELQRVGTKTPSYSDLRVFNKGAVLWQRLWSY